MRGEPIPPAEYDGEHLDTDAKLEAAGWAAGLDVWEQVGKAYGEQYLGDDTLGNAQLWSLREAIRTAERERVARYLERAAEQREKSGATGLAFDAASAITLREAVDWIREPSVWAPEESDGTTA